MNRLSVSAIAATLSALHLVTGCDKKNSPSIVKATEIQPAQNNLSAAPSGTAPAKPKGPKKPGGAAACGNATCG